MSNVQTLQQPVIDFYEIEEVAASVIFPEVYAKAKVQRLNDASTVIRIVFLAIQITYHASAF